MSADAIPARGAGQQELVVIASPAAALRAHGTRMGSAADADTSSLNSLLDARGARLRPLFGLSEDRLRDRAAASPTSSAASGEEPEQTRPDAPVEDLALFYRAEAPEERLDELARELLGHELVEAAYVKPAAAPPSTSPAINDMQPAAGDVPPTTPDFVSRQGYLAVAPSGVVGRSSARGEASEPRSTVAIDCRAVNAAAGVSATPRGCAATHAVLNAHAARHLGNAHLDGLCRGGAQRVVCGPPGRGVAHSRPSQPPPLGGKGLGTSRACVGRARSARHRRLAAR